MASLGNRSFQLIMKRMNAHVDLLPLKLLQDKTSRDIYCLINRASQLTLTITVSEILELFF